jgi:hypothetical protein
MERNEKEDIFESETSVSVRVYSLTVESSKQKVMERHLNKESGEQLIFVQIFGENPKI